MRHRVVDRALVRLIGGLDQWQVARAELTLTDDIALTDGRTRAVLVSQSGDLLTDPVQAARHHRVGRDDIGHLVSRAVEHVAVDSPRASAVLAPTGDAAERQDAID